MKACETKQIQRVLKRLMKKVNEIKDQDEMPLYMKVLIEEAIKNTHQELKVIYAEEYNKNQFLA